MGGDALIAIGITTGVVAGALQRGGWLERVVAGCILGACMSALAAVLAAPGWLLAAADAAAIGLWCATGLILALLAR